VTCVSCACIALAIGGLLVYGLVFPKVGFHGPDKALGNPLHQEAVTVTVTVKGTLELQP
jgi:hypothetical protein